MLVNETAINLRIKIQCALFHGVQASPSQPHPSLGGPIDGNLNPIQQIDLESLRKQLPPYLKSGFTKRLLIGSGSQRISDGRIVNKKTPAFLNQIIVDAAMDKSLNPISSRVPQIPIKVEGEMPFLFNVSVVAPRCGALKGKKGLR